MYELDLTRYEEGMSIGGPKGLVMTCPHCQRSGCKVGNRLVAAGAWEPKVAHAVRIEWVTKRSERTGETKSGPRTRWLRVCDGKKQRKKKGKRRYDHVQQMQQTDGVREDAEGQAHAAGS